MKKRILGLLILSILISSLIIVQAPDYSDISDSADKLPQDPDELKEFGENRTSYLKQEWTKILEKSPIGRVMLKISNLFQALNPVWKVFIGLEYSPSWIFFLTLGLWIVVAILIYQPIENIIGFNRWVSLGIAIIIPTLAAQFGTFEKIIESLGFLFKNKWLIGLTIIIVIALTYVYNRFIKEFGEKLKAIEKKEHEKIREQKADTVEKIHDIKIKGAKGG